MATAARNNISVAERNRLLLANRGLICQTVNRFRKKQRFACRIGTREDCEQQALAEAVFAIEHWDASKGKLSTYIVSRVWWQLVNCSKTMGVIHIPNGSSSFQTGSLRARAMAAMADHANDRCLANMSAPNPWDDLVDKMDGHDLTLQLRKVLRKLPTREADIIRRHHGLMPYRTARDLSKIGRELGLTRERVRQLYKRGFKQFETYAIKAIAKRRYRCGNQPGGACRPAHSRAGVPDVQQRRQGGKLRIRSQQPQEECADGAV